MMNVNNNDIVFWSQLKLMPILSYGRRQA